jgi:hypothetical protein
LTRAFPAFNKKGFPVKTYRRIELTAFRRRVTIVSGEPAIDEAAAETRESLLPNDADTQESIEPESEAGRLILIEALRLLNEKLARSSPGD